MAEDKPALIERERRLIAFCRAAAIRRHEAETTAEKGFGEKARLARIEYEKAKDQARSTHHSRRSRLEAEYREAVGKAESAFEESHSKTKKEYEDRILSIQQARKLSIEHADRKMDEARWAADASHEASRIGNRTAAAEWQKAIKDLEVRSQSIRQQTVQRMIDYGQEAMIPSVGETLDAASVGTDPIQRYRQEVERAETLLEKFASLKLPAMLAGNLLVWIFIGIWLATAVPCFLSLDPLIAFLGSLAGSGALGGIAAWALSRRSRKLIAACYAPLGESLANQLRLAEFADAEGKQRFRRQREEIDRIRNVERERIEREHRKAVEAAEAEYLAATQEANAKYPPMLTEIAAARTAAMAAADADFPQKLAETDAELQSALTIAEENLRATLERLEESKAAAWQSVVDDWRKALSIIEKEAGSIAAEGDKLRVDWSVMADETRHAVESPTAALPFGAFELNLDRIPEGRPSDSRLASMVTPPASLPALASFADAGGLLIETQDRGREAALEIVRVYMTRLLFHLPPAKARFTIIDPVGLGENFAAFMHLADYDESLVTGRIWTEPQQIDQRLADLTQTIENVIQKYLRNEFPSIEAYNRQAGEVAAPYRFVVVANFPAGFTESSARRLLSIASSGRRCGVYTIITVDRRLALPTGVRLDDLASFAVRLQWNGSGFIWVDDDFGPFALEVDKPPENGVLTSILHVAGRRAKEASKVEVPFDIVVPDRSQWWTQDSRHGLRAPIGRAGAARLQYLSLGKGTSQHALVAGKTGSGKSSLLHALITSLALQYSPAELELYLLDFKKGVEFKAYATHKLPHARVVGIESEREFGLSVLQRLDLELKRRGDQFRSAGVQDIAAFRSAHPAIRMPRILFVVDEFQEFFVDDDRIAQEVSLLLDRLVRQGRAFGIHALLGSQTLGGAYSLARSTIGQMAVRIALQCSEADAHLILSDDNPAARLLSRPGEAIYNDANGLIEGNNLFQVVWLPDDLQEEYLRRIGDMAASDSRPFAEPAVVFEGNIPSDARSNLALNGWLDGSAPATAPKVLHAWLGDAVAIKEPTAAVFASRTAANLLFVGQQPEAAMGAIAVACVSLAAQLPGTKSDASAESLPHVVVLDGTPDDSALAGKLAAVAAALGSMAEFSTPRDAGRWVQRTADEVDRRLQTEGEHSPVFLVVYDIQRFRDLRKSDDDYGFSRSDEKSPALALAKILKEGPSVGIHVIVWCDSPNNLSRYFDRQALREFEMRVVFQMSANDSSNLIDTPLAARLGMHRAYFASEEAGVLEKFRPYGFPTADWLRGVKDAFRRRHPPE